MKKKEGKGEEKKRKWKSFLFKQLFCFWFFEQGFGSDMLVGLRLLYFNTFGKWPLAIKSENKSMEIWSCLG